MQLEKECKNLKYESLLEQVDLDILANNLKNEVCSLRGKNYEYSNNVRYELIRNDVEEKLRLKILKERINSMRCS